IARLRVTVDRPAGTKIQMSTDDQPVSDVYVDAERPIDPGTHVVEVTAPGFTKARTTVTLKEGETQTVQLKIEVDPNAPKEAPPVAPTPTGETPVQAPAQEPRSLTPVYVAAGVGALGLVVGGVTGILAISKSSSLSTDCDGKVCRDSAAKDN